MKTFDSVPFDYGQRKKEVAEFEQLLGKKKSLEERKDVLPFFRNRPQLSAFCGLLSRQIGEADRIAWEYPLFGDFGCDLVVGNAARGAYLFIEFEDAAPHSIFAKPGSVLPQAELEFAFGGVSGSPLAEELSWFVAETLDPLADAGQDGIEDLGQVRGRLGFGGGGGVVGEGGQGQGGVLSFGELHSPLVEGKTPPFYKPPCAGTDAPRTAQGKRKLGVSRAPERSHPSGVVLAEFQNLGLSASYCAASYSRSSASFSA